MSFTAKLNSSRAQNAVKWVEAFTRAGWKVFEVIGNEGDYYDLIFPECSMVDLPQAPLFITGRTETVGEVDGEWWAQDRDHPQGNVLLPDGTFGKERLNRSAGIHRYFLTDNTHRLCILPVNALGQRTYEAVAWEFPKGPRKITIEQGEIFVLSSGTGKLNGEPITAPHIVVAETDAVLIEMDKGSYGGWVWRIS